MSNESLIACPHENQLEDCTVCNPKGIASEIRLLTVDDVVEKLSFSGHPKYLDNPVTESERGLIRDVLAILKPTEPVLKGDSND